jgi:hypothetical protein
MMELYKPNFTLPDFFHTHPCCCFCGGGSSGGCSTKRKAASMWCHPQMQLVGATRMCV